MRSASAPSGSRQEAPFARPDPAGSDGRRTHASAPEIGPGPDAATAQNPALLAAKAGRWRGIATWSTLSGALVVAQVLGSALVLARGYYFQDDYLFISRAVAHPLLSSEVLLEHWSGHFMPAGMALSWLLARADPFAYGPVIGLLVGMQAAAAILFRLLARRLLGSGRAHVLAVLVYATSMPVLVAAAWWAAAINVVPMQIALFLAAWLLASRSVTRSHQIGAVLAVAAGLLFFEKAVLIPFVLFGLAWAQRPERGWRVAASRAFRAQRGLWGALVAVLAGYAVVYVVTAAGATTAGLPLARTVADASSRALANFTTSLLGGPVDWVIGFEALATPPLWLVVAALQVMVLGGLLTLALSGRVAGRWLLLGAGTAIVGLALMLVGRPDGAALLASAPRYFADAVPVAALAIGGALASARGGVPAPLAGSRAWLAGRRGAFALLAVGNAVILLAVASSAGVVAWLAANPSRGYVSTTVRSLEALTERTQILDTAVPSFVLGSFVAPENRQSNVFGLVSPHAEYREQTAELLVVPPGGGLVPGALGGPLATTNLPGAEPQCGWRIAGDVDVRLQREIEGIALRIGYIATSGGTVQVSVGSFPPTTLTIQPGLHLVHLAVQGTGSSVSFTDLTDGVQLCTDELAFGTPVPAAS